MYLIIEAEDPIEIIGSRQIVEYQSSGFMERTVFSFPISMFTNKNVETLKKYFNGYDNENNKKYTFTVYSSETQEVLYSIESSGFLSLEFECMEDSTRLSEMYFTGSIFGLCPLTKDN